VDKIKRKGGDVKFLVRKGLARKGKNRFWEKREVPRKGLPVARTFSLKEVFHNRVEFCRSITLHSRWGGRARGGGKKGPPLKTVGNREEKKGGGTPACSEEERDAGGTSREGGGGRFHLQDLNFA